MSAIVVYRTFYWTGERLAGQTGYVWETKEEQARCIKDSSALDLMLRSQFGGSPPLTSTKDQQRQDARYHIAHQGCLCGIYGYFSPNYLGLMTVPASGVGIADRKGVVVFTRVRLGGLVDIHSLGARGEYGLIEEAWCDDDIVAKAVAKQYDIPVNQSKYEKQPRTDPIIDRDAKVVRLSPLFNGISEAVAIKNSFNPGFTPSPFAGIKAIPTQKMIPGRSLPPLGSPFSTLCPMPSVIPGPLPYPVPPGPNCSCGICASVGVSNLRGRCPALLGGICLCGAHGFTGRGVLGSWKCSVCGQYERYAGDHLRCGGTAPKIVPTNRIAKPGIITRIKRKLNKWGLT